MVCKKIRILKIKGLLEFKNIILIKKVIIKIIILIIYKITILD